MPTTNDPPPVMGRRRYAALLGALAVVSIGSHMLSSRIGGRTAIAIEATTFLGTLWPSWRISVARARDAGRGPRWVLRIYGIVLASMLLAGSSAFLAVLAMPIPTLAAASGSLILMAVALRMEATLVFARAVPASSC